MSIVQPVAVLTCFNQSYHLVFMGPLYSFFKECSNFPLQNFRTLGSQE